MNTYSSPMISATTIPRIFFWSPRPDRAGNVLKIIVLVFDDGRRMAIHAMPIRPRCLHILPKQGEPDA